MWGGGKVADFDNPFDAAVAMADAVILCHMGMQSFSDVWMDAQFASLKALIVRMVSGSSDAAVADFSLLPEENGIPERTDEELMHLGEGISGGVRYGPDSQPGH